MQNLSGTEFTFCVMVTSWICLSLSLYPSSSCYGVGVSSASNLSKKVWALKLLIPYNHHSDLLMPADANSYSKSSISQTREKPLPNFILVLFTCILFYWYCYCMNENEILLIRHSFRQITATLHLSSQNIVQKRCIDLMLSPKSHFPCSSKKKWLQNEQRDNKWNNTVCIWNTFSHAITLNWKTPPMLFLSINWIIMPLVLKAWFKLLWASMLWMLEVESISSVPVVHVDRW